MQRLVFKEVSKQHMGFEDIFVCLSFPLSHGIIVVFLLTLPGDDVIDMEILHILGFDSNRKRMSVIIRGILIEENFLS